MGGCHCGGGSLAGRARRDDRQPLQLLRLHEINQLSGRVKPDALRLLTPESALGAYAWGGKIATRYFCKTCGVHCFAKGHLAELGGDFAVG